MRGPARSARRRQSGPKDGTRSARTSDAPLSPRTARKAGPSRIVMTDQSVYEIPMASVKTEIRRKREQKEARRSEIISAALRLFAAKGFAATRLDDVAEAAGIAKGTVYLYFETKEELFREIVRQELLPTLDRLEEAVAAHQGPAADLFRLLFAGLARLIDSDAGAIPKLVVCEAGNFPEIARFYADEVVGRGRYLEGILKRGIERGEFRPVDTANILPGFIGPVLLMLFWRHSIGAIPSGNSTRIRCWPPSWTSCCAVWLPIGDAADALSPEARARRRARDLDLLRRSSRLGCRRTAACSDSARRCRAACTGWSRPSARRCRPAARRRRWRPAVMPTKMPSFCASSRAAAHARRRRRSAGSRRSRPVSTASSVSFGMKSGVQPCIGCGLKAGWRGRRRPVGIARLRRRRCPAAARRPARRRRSCVSGPLLGQHARDALQRAAGAVARDPVVEPLALEVARGSRARWCASACRHWPRSRTGGVRNQPCVSASSTALASMPHAALGGRRQHDLGAEEAHQLAALDAEALGHRDDQRIALLRADHREPDAGVAAGRLDHGLAGLQRAGAARRPR